MITMQNDVFARTLDIDAVRAFTLVAELQSFTRAAQATATTQSAVSLKLKRLENRLSARLVERTSRSVRLTAAGASFLARATYLPRTITRSPVLSPSNGGSRSASATTSPVPTSQT